MNKEYEQIKADEFDKKFLNYYMKLARENSLNN